MLYLVITRDKQFTIILKYIIYIYYILVLCYILFIHDTDYMCDIIVRFRSGQQEHTATIHIYIYLYGILQFELCGLKNIFNIFLLCLL